jgi:AcrR family transcriptional regulator
MRQQNVISEPAGREPNVYESLLIAAEHCLLGKSHLDLTTREIAATAGTQAGMINYYFEGKDGLMFALVDGIAKDADRHLRQIGVAYWKGGDEELERQLYQPHVIEKLIAWGGFASVKHVTKYIQPGLELITLDPKRSVSIIGHEALRDDATRLWETGLIIS